MTGFPVIQYTRVFSVFVDIETNLQIDLTLKRKEEKHIYELSEVVRNWGKDLFLYL